MTASAAVSCSVPSITRTTTPAVRSASPPVRRLWSPLNVIPVELRRAHSASDPSEHQQLPPVPPWSARHAEDQERRGENARSRIDRCTRSLLSLAAVPSSAGALYPKLQPCFGH